MSGGHPFVFLRLPFDLLAALDSRTFHYALQPYHHLVRMTHVLTVAAFFGGIMQLDLRLMGWRATVPLRAFAEHVLPWLYGTFGVAIVTGLALFFYDPIGVGSHGYFTPKLIFLLIGLANAAVFHRSGYVAALASESRMPTSARIAGAVSLLTWIAVMVFASLNVEGAPKVLLR
ncbi:MAG TPA: hypothetical protein VGM42_14295 [Rhodopila sp.]|jgi:hypothetical protein